MANDSRTSITSEGWAREYRDEVASSFSNLTFINKVRGYFNESLGAINTSSDEEGGANSATSSSPRSILCSTTEILFAERYCRSPPDRYAHAFIIAAIKPLNEILGECRERYYAR
ncbi:hypothetical protein ACJ72_05836 [Emergomyces africanus]|uniref:Uncharacterized protein n=1 Tax=Emergomyces africanus TaxID=1955775 RepID=A0A1B7NSS8_9EURO|nr:hypothetical protein ACJ72_05836 [Emergomyces africanus]